MQSSSQATFLQQRGAAPLPPTQTGEEKSPDKGTATDSRLATPITTLGIQPNPQVLPRFRFFVDGVQRTVAIAQVEINGVFVPIHMAHVAAGAMVRQDRQMAPQILRQALVLLLPYQALALADPTKWTVPPPGQLLSGLGNIYGLVQNNGFTADYYSDTSIDLRNQNVAIEAGDLVRTGTIRAAALDRANVLMRVLELGVLWELRQLYPDEWILLDGPIAPLTKYARLVIPSLYRLQDIADPVAAFDFLCKLVGAVKEVKIVPTTGLEQAFQNNGPLSVPVYRFADTVDQTEEIAKEVVSAFVRLRRELSAELSPIWSVASGLARFDIPLPAVLPNDPNTQSTWNTFDDPQVVTMLQPGQTSGQKLQEMLETLVLERWPVPAATPARVFVELFPIAETERWITASLYDAQEIQVRGMK